MRRRMPFVQRLAGSRKPFAVIPADDFVPPSITTPDQYFTVGWWCRHAFKIIPLHVANLIEFANNCELTVRRNFAPSQPIFCHPRLDACGGCPMFGSFLRPNPARCTRMFCGAI